MSESDEKKINEQDLFGRRKLKRDVIQQTPNISSSENPIDKNNEDRKSHDKEIDNNSKRGKHGTQVLAYVATVFSVSVVDILKGKEIKRITLDADPIDIAISPDKRFAYVSYYDISALGVIDICENKEVSRVYLNKTPFAGLYPVGVAISPDGKYIYTANHDSSNISVIEAERYCWRVVAEIPLTKAPLYIAVTPNGRLAYATLRENSEIAVSDLITNLLIKIIPAGTRPVGIAINKDYVGFAMNARSNDITVFNGKLAQSSPITIPVSGENPIHAAFNPKGNIAYVTNRFSNTVSVIDVFKHTEITTIPVGIEPIEVAVSEDGRFTVVANSADNTVSIIDTKIRKVIYTVGVGLEPFGIEIVTLTGKVC